jgi:hypothetical protein
MAQAAAARTKINTLVTQPAPGRGSRPSAGPRKPVRPAKRPRMAGMLSALVAAGIEAGYLVNPRLA